MLGQIFALPLKVPTEPIMFIWVIPISLSIALVYKSIRLEKMSLQLFLREVFLLFITIVGTLIGSGVVLWGFTVLVYR